MELYGTNINYFMASWYWYGDCNFSNDRQMGDPIHILDWTE